MKRLFPFILVLIAFASCKVEKTELVLNLEMGKTYRQVMSSKVTMGQDINGQHMDIKMTVAGEMAFLVKSFEKSLYELDVTYESLSMEMEGPQGKLAFNSENIIEENMVSQLLAALKNTPFTIVVDQSGKVNDVNGINKLFDALVEKFPDIPSFQLKPIKEQLMQSYGEEAFIESFELATAIYPENPVAEGDQWSIETNLKSGISSRMKTDYSFMGSDEKYNLIQGESIITPIENEVAPENNESPILMKLSGMMTSDIKVNKNTGWIVEAKIFQDLSGTAHMKPSPQSPEGMSFPMTMKSETVIRDK